MRKQKKRKRILVVSHPLALRAGKRYKGIIRSIEIDKKSTSLRVTIENLDPSQSGRIHEITLPAALFVGSKTARFIAAAGQDANTVGKQICIDEIVGAVVGMRFGTPDGSDKDIEFERIESPQAINADVSVKESRDEAPPIVRSNFES
jgi:hypothetical protein